MLLEIGNISYKMHLSDTHTITCNGKSIKDYQKDIETECAGRLKQKSEGLIREPNPNSGRHTQIEYYLVHASIALIPKNDARR